MSQKRVVVGMSGGVDSSVAALLLQQQGYDVIGLFMNNWADLQGECTGAQDYEDVMRVCDTLHIPCYMVNFTQEYWDGVFTQFLHELSLGYTPNPDVLCNREIKFKALLTKAQALGADLLATGHYAQTREGALMRSVDTEKDQTYFLSQVDHRALMHVMFPVGHLLKSETRALAAQHGLATARKRDSTGICFIGEHKFTPFLQQYLPSKEGVLMTLEGVVVGTHVGTPFYTVGQRKGLNIGGKGEAWFVVGKDIERNIVFVVQGNDHPALYRSHLQAQDLVWIQEAAPKFPLRCTAKIRYRQPDQMCTVAENGSGVLDVTFDQPQRAVTPRQAVVFYQGPRCLGGGWII